VCSHGKFVEPCVICNPPLAADNTAHALQSRLANADKIFSNQELILVELQSRLANTENEHDKLVERSVGAMAIAEGDEGHEAVPRDCPMLVAVSELRVSHDNLAAKVDAISLLITSSSQWTASDILAIIENTK